MHTNPPMYNPMIPSHHEDMGDPNHSNFNITYGTPNYTMPTYPVQNNGYPNYAPNNYADDRNQMPRDRNQEYVPRKSHYGFKNQGHFQKDSQYNRNRPMGNGRNGMNNNGNKFQRGPSRNQRDNDSYRNHSSEGNYHDDKVLPQSRKIMKPMRNPSRRQDGPGPRPNYDNHQSYNPNYSKPFQKRPMRQDPDQDSDDAKGANSLMFYKTKLCPHLAEGGCTRGSHCNYAHSETELRDVPNLKKTKLCQLFMMGKCNRGNMCSFAHGEQELRSTPEFFKTSICNGYLKGSCRAGDNCRYAHGKDELRNKYDVYPSYSTEMPMQAPEYDNGNGFGLNTYQPIDSGNVDLSKDPKNSRFIINGNNMHSYINQQMPMDSNPIDPNYLNNNQGPNGVKSSPSNRNDNLAQNPYNLANIKFNNYVPTNNNNWDRNVPPANKPVNSQGEHPDNITFHPYNPEKINSLFTTPNENPNFLK